MTNLSSKRNRNYNGTTCSHCSLLPAPAPPTPCTPLPPPSPLTPRATAAPASPFVHRLFTVCSPFVHCTGGTSDSQTPGTAPVTAADTRRHPPTGPRPHCAGPPPSPVCPPFRWLLAAVTSRLAAKLLHCHFATPYDYNIMWYMYRYIYHIIYIYIYMWYIYNCMQYIHILYCDLSVTTYIYHV